MRLHVEAYLDEHPEFLESYVIRKVKPSTFERWQLLGEARTQESVESIWLLQRDLDPGGEVELRVELPTAGSVRCPTGERPPHQSTVNKIFQSTGEAEYFTELPPSIGRWPPS